MKGIANLGGKHRRPSQNFYALRVAPLCWAAFRDGRKESEENADEGRQFWLTARRHYGRGRAGGVGSSVVAYGSHYLSMRLEKFLAEAFCLSHVAPTVLALCCLVAPWTAQPVGNGGSPILRFTTLGITLKALADGSMPDTVSPSRYMAFAASLAAVESRG